ncbi:MAG: hemerythrin domain-containing protein [Gallionella sp.]|jgi:hemerythrin-like domain-containing protein
MKRSAILQPLSREHHSALILAQTCKRAALSGESAQITQACQRAILAFSAELEVHFQFEEQSLLPLLRSPETQALVQRTLADHERLRALLHGLQQTDAVALDNFGQCLAEHVRFEERELFAVLESLLGAR